MSWSLVASVRIKTGLLATLPDILIAMGKKTTKVVIVGGGFAGVKTALNLAKNPSFQVQLISNNTHFEYHGALYRSAVGRSPMEVVIPLRDIFKGSSVEVVLDSIDSIDHQKKCLISGSGTAYPYDAAVLAMGNTVNYFGIEGMEQHTETMHDIASTVKLRHSLVKILQKPRRQSIKIVVVGAGASGVELASEIPAFAKLVAKRHAVKPNLLKVTLVDSADRVLPMLSEKSSTKAAKRLLDLGIQLKLGVKAQSCQPGKICLESGELPADLIVWTAGSKPVDFYKRNTDFALSRTGRVVVDDYLQAENMPGVYVLGDNADTKYSGMAQTALYDANFVSRNLVRLSKKQPVKSYRARKPLFVVTVGAKWAVVEDGRKILSGISGWTVRRRADLAIFKNFQPYKQAVKTWRYANRLARF